MSDNHDLDYRHLVNCHVEIASTGGSSLKPVTLPQECWRIANAPIPKLYDFALEKSIVSKNDSGADCGIRQINSKEELERSLLVKMKSVTNASEDVCISLLEHNSFDLKTSIEAYFAQGSNSSQ